ncbi:hypothetical protein HrrHc1_140 [Halorubrum phage Hardycor1]|nr:hypothetical protein HrrHc1_140 [Halorubrum phage Hardycor1]
MRVRFERPDEFEAEPVTANVDLEHTSISSFTASFAYDEAFEDAASAFAPVTIMSDGDPLVRFIATRSESDNDRGTTTVEGRGRGWYLTRDEASVRYQNEFAFEALASFGSAKVGRLGRVMDSRSRLRAAGPVRTGRPFKNITGNQTGHTRRP